MGFPATLIDLAGFVALLLWGTYMVQNGIQSAFGLNLKVVLGRALRNRFAAFLAGLGVTAVLQSSTATGLMISGFAAGGLVALVPGLAVMLGANVGTTLIVQVLSFDVAAAAPVLILVGLITFRRGSAHRAKDLGRTCIGLGLMLLALHQLLGLMTDYDYAPSLRILLGAVSTSPTLDVLLAAVLTWAMHSSVAVVLLIMSLADQGVVPPTAAFALVLGANLGTAINPLLEGGSTDDPATKRLPIGNLLTRIAGVVVVLPFIHPIGAFLVTTFPDAGRAVADFHTLFNIVMAAIFFPFLSVFARALERFLPKRADPTDPSVPLYLDPQAQQSPMVALGAAAREALRLADVLGDMLAGARTALAIGGDSNIEEARKRDDVLDSLNVAIKHYLSSLDPDELNEDDSRRLNEILRFTMGLEQAGDAVDNGLLPHVSKRLERGLAFSKEEQAELLCLLDRLSSNLKMAASLFMTEDIRIARVLADEKVAFRTAEAKATVSHLERQRSGNTDAARASALHLDLLRDIKRINSLVVAAAAYPVLEREGDLLPSRIVAMAQD